MTSNSWQDQETVKCLWGFLDLSGGTIRIATYKMFSALIIFGINSVVSPILALPPLLSLWLKEVPVLCLDEGWIMMCVCHVMSVCRTCWEISQCRLFSVLTFFWGNFLQFPFSQSGTWFQLGVPSVWGVSLYWHDKEDQERLDGFVSDSAVNIAFCVAETTSLQQSVQVWHVDTFLCRYWVHWTVCELELYQQSMDALARRYEF